MRILVPARAAASTPGTQRRTGERFALPTRAPTFDDADPEPPAWEPEPLELPIDGPDLPGRGQRDDDADDDVMPGAVVIDLC